MSLQDPHHTRLHRPFYPRHCGWCGDDMEPTERPHKRASTCSPACRDEYQKDAQRRCREAYRARAKAKAGA